MNIKLINTTVNEAQIIRKTFFKGLGLHTSKKSFIIIRNNPKKDGIIFVTNGIRKKITPGILSTKEKTTTIIHNKKKFIICIEHLMSAFCGLGVLNAIIEVRGEREIPILSGNSYCFIEKLLPNIAMVTTKNKSIVIAKPITIFDDYNKDRYIKLSPWKKSFLQIKSVISYNDSYAQKQCFIFNFKNSSSYINEISRAKTSFPFKIDDKEKFLQLLKRLKGIKTFGKNKNINIYPLNNASKTYYKNEIARHKILDFLGDFKSVAVNLIGTKIELHKTGHNLNLKLANFFWESLKNKKS